MNKYIDNEWVFENEQLKIRQLMENVNEGSQKYLEILKVIYKDKDLSTLQRVSDRLVYIFGTSLRDW